MPQNLLAEKSVQLKKENDHLEGTICIDLETVRLWDNHDPYLYHAYVELKAEDGSLVEVIPYDIGFGRIEIIDSIICATMQEFRPGICFFMPSLYSI